MGPRRCSSYGIRANEYFEWAEKEIMTINQIKAGEAVEIIEKILTVDGVDVVFLGPTDRSTSLGVRGKLDHPKFTEALERVVKAASASGVPAGIMAHTAEQAHEARQRCWMELVTGKCDFRAAFPRSSLSCDNVRHSSHIVVGVKKLRIGGSSLRLVPS